MTQTQPSPPSLLQIARWEPHVRALVGWEGHPIDAKPVSGDGPLSGWTVGVKDIIDVAGAPTGLGASFIPPAPASHDALVVRDLRRLGARIVAKTVTTTFAWYDPGPTRNPWNTRHTPGGSSSGSAAAVACGMVRLALGTQTIGSINRPAAYCGVVGFKPSFGCLPVAGVFPLAADVDTVGTFTIDVEDASSAFASLTATSVEVRDTPLRVGVVGDLLCRSPDESMRDAVERAASRLERSGHAVRHIELPASLAASYAHHRRLVAVAALDAHRELVVTHEAAYPPKMLELLEHGRSQSTGDIAEARKHRNEARSTWASIFSELDVIVCAAAPGTAPAGTQATGDPRMNLLGTYLGIPALTLPIGLAADGLPLGIQLLGEFKRDAGLLACARVVEEVFDFRDKPIPPE